MNSTYMQLVYLFIPPGFPEISHSRERSGCANTVTLTFDHQNVNQLILEFKRDIYANFEEIA